MPQPFANYFKNQWLLGNIDSTYIETQVTKNRLTRAEADEILALPQASA